MLRVSSVANPDAFFFLGGTPAQRLGLPTRRLNATAQKTERRV